MKYLLLPFKEGKFKLQDLQKKITGGYGSEYYLTYFNLCLI